MKNSRSQNNMQNKQMMSHQHRPEIRDNLDSRSNEEQQTKGDDVTHNAKDIRNNRQKKQKD
jgi:N-acetyl-gamma-glutamylphosphate reductase